MNLNDNQKNEFWENGFITINISDKGYFMDYYNNNGSWETLCINGLRWLF